MFFQQLLNKATSHPKQLFLLDSLGALLSASFLGLIMPKLESIFGMPPKVLYVLALIASVFVVYSFVCFLSFPKIWRLFLKGIAIANLLYCCLTLGLVIQHFKALTILGIAYFIVEIMIVVLLAVIEYKTALSE